MGSVFTISNKYGVIEPYNNDGMENDGFWVQYRICLIEPNALILIEKRLFNIIRRRSEGIYVYIVSTLTIRGGGSINLVINKLGQIQMGTGQNG